jgi:hypothetical protein
VALHFAHERRDFGEIGAGADNIDDFQAVGHESSEASESESIAFGFGRFGAPE